MVYCRSGNAAGPSSPMRSSLWVWVSFRYSRSSAMRDYGLAR